MEHKPPGLTGSEVGAILIPLHIPGSMGKCYLAQEHSKFRYDLYNDFKSQVKEPSFTLQPKPVVSRRGEKSSPQAHLLFRNTVNHSQHSGNLTCSHACVHSTLVITQSCLTPAGFGL